ncbi:hypothetical protein ACIQ6V_15795 [Streptomyces sp. NPDC096198]|uniref:hypothetical protein n=1 Tax=Streptomyces sp. NPDC096198 TaxID=3366080 RepID=UPI00381C45EA
MSYADYYVEGDECGYTALIHDPSGETVAEGGCTCCSENEVTLQMLIDSADLHQEKSEAGESEGP